MAIDISIVMCTYNGAAYLDEQLESIRLQTVQPRELVICDDGSLDRTPEIVKDFAKHVTFPVRYVVNAHRLGVTRNFAKAMREAKGQYIALCDQDDVWYADKLEKQMALMAATEKECGSDKPILVHSDLRVVSENRELINNSLFNYQKLSPTWIRPLDTLLIQNFVTGCSVIVNRALVEVALPLPSRAVMHDWWLALCASLFGEIRTLPEATIDYRQHANNQVGARGYWVRIMRGLIGYDPPYNIAFKKKVEQSMALQEHVYTVRNKVAKEYAVKSLQCFTAIFLTDKGWAHRFRRTLSCSVRPNTVFRFLNYLMRVIFWRTHKSL